MRDGRAEPRGLAPPSDFGELSRAAAVPVPLSSAGTGARKKGASPQQYVDRLNGEPARLAA